MTRLDHTVGVEACAAAIHSVGSRGGEAEGLGLNELGEHLEDSIMILLLKLVLVILGTLGEVVSVMAWHGMAWVQDGRGMACKDKTIQQDASKTRRSVQDTSSSRHHIQALIHHPHLTCTLTSRMQTSVSSCTLLPPRRRVEACAAAMHSVCDCVCLLGSRGALGWCVA